MPTIIEALPHAHATITGPSSPRTRKEAIDELERVILTLQLYHPDILLHRIHSGEPDGFEAPN